MTSRVIETARAKAERILREHLDDCQQADLDAHGWFDVRRGDRVYRIERGRFGNISIIVGGAVIDRLCVHPVPDLPDADTMLAQKLLLEADEPALLLLANHTGPPPVVRDRGSGRPMSRTDLIAHALETPEGRYSLTVAVLGAMRYGPRRAGAVSESLDGSVRSNIEGRLEVADRIVSRLTEQDTGREIQVLTRWARLARRQRLAQRSAA